MPEQSRNQVLIIDDDLLIRDLLELLLSRKGCEVYQTASGEEALSMLTDQRQVKPSVVLADMQLPGIAGAALAHQLRTLLGKETQIVAMSAKQPGQNELEGFDRFVGKTFHEDTLNSLFQPTVPLSNVEDGDSADASPLNEAVYERLASSMSQKQLTELYQLCLDDCRRRMDAIRHAASRNNVDTCAKEAHTIKGSCGMVGAKEIASLGELIESDGLVANVEDALGEMMLACRRLEEHLRARGLCIQP
ncbi:MAG TPA: response regulator [Edaphobacter sp.]|nr:response regulator [Edaphobacter sp.]